MKRFKNILCIVDMDVPDEVAFKRAVMLAESNQASLMVVAISQEIKKNVWLPESGPSSNELKVAVCDAQMNGLQALIAPFKNRIEVSASVLSGIPFIEIIREVLQRGYDLVIKTPDSYSWKHHFFGSDDLHLLRKCPCPVWLIKPEARKSYRRILAAVDVDDGYSEEELNSRQKLNRQVFEMASSLALSDFAELHIGYAWDAIGESAMRGTLMQTPEHKIKTYVSEVKRHEEKNMAAFLNEMDNSQFQESVDYLKPEIHLVKGVARREIPKLAKKVEADLVIMGTVGRTGIPGFIMGNTAEEILNGIECSVLAIKPAGFVSPVTLES